MPKLAFDGKAESSERDGAQGRSVPRIHLGQPIAAAGRSTGRPAHHATHLPICHFAAHHTHKITLIEVAVKQPSPGHIERWVRERERG